MIEYLQILCFIQVFHALLTINMKILTFDKKYIKCDKDALLYELEDYYISHVERKLVLDDDELSCLNITSENQLFGKKTQLLMILNVQRIKNKVINHILIIG